MDNDLNAEKNGSPVKILIADSYRSNLILMGRILSNFDCEYDFAKSGSEALVKLELDDFNLMFLECSMPGMEGHSVVRKIKQLVKHEGLKIICTASLQTRKQSGSRCENCGVDGFLDRPLGMWKIRGVFEKDFPEVLKR